MSKYECLNCHKVFCGWSVKWKYKFKCPNCGGELREASNKEKSQKSRRYPKGGSEISRYRVSG